MNRGTARPSGTEKLIMGLCANCLLGARSRGGRLCADKWPIASG